MRLPPPPRSARYPPYRVVQLVFASNFRHLLHPEEIMGIFDKFKGDDEKKKKPKADFSNVKAGGSSTAAPP